MKNIFLIMISLLFLTGCSRKVDIASLNIPTHLIQSEYSTYNISEEKITTYFFKNKNGILHVSDVISYIPRDIYGDMYGPFSPVTWDLQRISTEDTLNKALEKEVAKKNYQLLYNNKNEYIIDNDFAFRVMRIIDEYNEIIERRERDRDKGLNMNIIFTLP